MLAVRLGGLVTLYPDLWIHQVVWEAYTFTKLSFGAMHSQVGTIRWVRNAVTCFVPFMHTSIQCMFLCSPHSFHFLRRWRTIFTLHCSISMFFGVCYNFQLVFNGVAMSSLFHIHCFYVCGQILMKLCGYTTETHRSMVNVYVRVVTHSGARWRRDRYSRSLNSCL